MFCSRIGWVLTMTVLFDGYNYFYFIMPIRNNYPETSLPSRYRADSAAIPSNQTTSTSKTNDREMYSVVQAMSDRLETGLNIEALSAIVDLLKAGVHPDAVVAVVTSLSQRQTR